MSEPTCISSGDIDDSTLIVTGRGILRGIIVTSSDNNSADIEVFDGQDTSGDLLANVKIGGGNNQTRVVMFTAPVRFVNGLYVDVSGSPNRVVIYYGG